MDPNGFHYHYCLSQLLPPGKEFADAHASVLKIFFGASNGLGLKIIKRLYCTTQAD